MNDADLQWVAAQRPVPAPPARAATARARAALTAHASEPPLVLLRPERRNRRLRWPIRVAVAAAVAGAAAFAATLVGSGSSGPAGLGVQNAAAAPLLRLAEHVAKTAQATPLPGDATLIERLHTFPDQRSFTGADLYLDDGTYYYAPTRAGLPAAMAAGPVSDPDGSIARQVAAAVAATTLPIDQARLRMANAAFPDGKAPSEAELDRQARAAQADRAKAGVKVDHSPLPPATPEAILNGEIWSNSLDALQAGAGKPEVRAGVLDLLATIPGVQVRHTTTDGKAALELDSPPGRTATSSSSSSMPTPGRRSASPAAIPASSRASRSRTR
jgi:hypothetical protein